MATIEESQGRQVRVEPRVLLDFGNALVSTVHKSDGSVEYWHTNDGGETWSLDTVVGK